MINCKILKIDKGLFLYNTVLVEFLEDLNFTKGSYHPDKSKVYVIEKGERKFLKIKKTKCIFIEGEHFSFKLSDFNFFNEFSYPNKLVLVQLFKIHTFVITEQHIVNTKLHKEYYLNIVHESKEEAKKICKEIFSHGRNFKYVFSSFLYEEDPERFFEKEGTILYTNYPAGYLRLIRI